MKNLFWSLLLLMPLLAHAPAAQAQQQTIYCVALSSTPCNSNVNPGTGVQGDPAWKFNGKSNANFTQLFNMYSIVGIPYFHGGPPNIPTLATASQIAATFPGTAGAGWCLGTNGVTQACSGGGGGGGTPGGTSGQVQYNNGGSFGGFTFGGDCTLNTTTGIIICTKSSGVPFALSAFNDTTNAANITSGVLGSARIPAALPGTTSVNGSTVAASAGTLPGSTGSFTIGDCLKVGATSPLEIQDFGANCGGGGGGGSPGGSNLQVQYNNSGLFAGFTVGGDCTLTVSTGVMICTKTNGANFSASATVDTTNATNIATGTLAANRLPAALAASTSINGTTIAASAGTAAGSTGTFTLGDCLKVGSVSPLEIQDQGSTCGAGGGGGSPGGSSFTTQYNNAGSFGGVGPGTTGQLLTSNGAAAAPSYQSGVGVLSLTTDTAPLPADWLLIYQASSNTTQKLSFAFAGVPAIATNTFYANLTGGTAVPSQTTTAQFLGLVNGQTPPNPQTGNYTAQLNDANQLIPFNNTSAQALTIPPNSSVNYPLGAVLTPQQTNTGTTSVNLGAGVSFANPYNVTMTTYPIAAKNGSAQFQQQSTNVWTVVDTTQVQLTSTTVALLPACAASTAGRLYMVTDATSPTYNGTLTGGSTVVAMAMCNGTAWTAH